jgi:hypothetical protein
VPSPNTGGAVTNICRWSLIVALFVSVGVLKADDKVSIVNSENFHGFKDAAGNAAVPDLLVFKTK